jgi:hypothetical protein
MYPTADERAVIAEAEKVMQDAMARYDPSHDAYHGAPLPFHAFFFLCRGLRLRGDNTVQRVRRTALALAKSISPTPDLLVVELGGWTRVFTRRSALTAPAPQRPSCTTFSTRNTSPRRKPRTRTRSSSPSSRPWQRRTSSISCKTAARGRSPG